jgi:thiol:disulfide interchange protein
MILAGPRGRLAAPRPVAEDVFMRGTRYQRKGFLTSVKIGSQSQPHIAGRIRALPATILSYRAPKDMSTRKLAVAIFALVGAIFFASGVRLTRAAEQVAAANDSLPVHALKDSSSLYLREAAAGPVRWQQWNEATFTLARTLKRPMLIDIGAVWCHWCHVMDETTYADPKVAAMVNDYFVPVKVDTDERPDIDGYYQAAAQNFSAGGWPLTCFATPDGAPLLIAGYLPPNSEEHRGMLQRELAKRVVLKYTPHLNFKLDDSIERGSRVLEIMQDLEKPRDDQ